MTAGTTRSSLASLAGPTAVLGRVSLNTEKLPVGNVTSVADDNHVLMCGFLL